jgi:RimJ/RimL family protein N-acetyltransferase
MVKSFQAIFIFLFTNITTHATFLYESKRIMYREFTYDDVQALELILCDKEVMEYNISYPELIKAVFHVFCQQEIQDFIARQITSYQEHGFGLYAMIKKDDGTLIGITGLKEHEFEGKHYPMIVYRLAKKYWGLGYANEAARATCDYTRDVLHMPEMIATIDPANIPSIKVIKKAGFSFWKVAPFRGFPFNFYRINF